MGLLVSNYSVYHTGIQLDNAYLKITGVNLDAISNQCSIHCDYFLSKQLADEGKQKIGIYSTYFTVTDPNGNLRQQAYEYLKTLPEFAGAIDILEE